MELKEYLGELLGERKAQNLLDAVSEGKTIIISGPVFEDAEVPDGAYIYSRQCRITREADGWHGSIGGTGGY